MVRLWNVTGFLFGVNFLRSISVSCHNKCPFRNKPSNHAAVSKPTFFTQRLSFSTSSNLHRRSRRSLTRPFLFPLLFRHRPSSSPRNHRRLLISTAAALIQRSPQVIQREPWEHIKDEDIRKAAASFRGEIWQVPPMFSAIKVGGEKMYDKARRGEMLELSPRRITILEFDIERSLDDRQNLIFRVSCSKGTYIRSLCADFGKALAVRI